MPFNHTLSHIKFDELIIIGATDGLSLQESIQDLNATKVTVIEADEKKLKKLNNYFSGQSNVIVKPAVVTASGGEASWFEYNLDEFNGTKKADDLKVLFPGLVCERQSKKDSVKLAEALPPLSGNTLLQIDLPGQGLELISSLPVDILSTIDYLAISTTQERLFEAGDSLVELSQWLQSRDYRKLDIHYDDPDFPLVIYAADNELKKLKKERAELSARVDELKAELDKVSKERDQAQLAVDSLNKGFADSQTYLLQKIDELRESQEQQTKQITDTVIRKTANSTKQIEAFLGVQQFFTDGEVGLNFHGWPISSDIAMYLLNKIKQENFDLIIEFGSGTSTIMFAKAVATLTGESFKQVGSNDEQQRLEHARREQQSRSLQTLDIEDAGEVPSRVVSFEHNKTFYDKTLAGLVDAGVHQMVSLVHAPLVDWSYKGEDYLYYDCDKMLANIAEYFEGRVAKIMVFIDGPPASTGEQARYPAVPKVLQHLSRHELHIIMDDYVREDEKKAAGRWSKMIEERGIPCEKELIRLEKDGFSWILNRGA